MRLRGWFFVLALFVCGILILLALQTFLHIMSLFYVAEMMVIVTLIVLVFFYRQVINPIRAIGNGMELLKEQDFGSRLRSVNQKDADKIVEVFNRMITQLKDERLRVREQNEFLDLLINASPMGVIILDFDRHVASLNPAASRFIGCTDSEIVGKRLTDMHGELIESLAAMPQDSSDTFQLNDSHIFRCSSLSFFDHGFAHPFLLIESLTDEVMKAEKKAYEKVIRMIAHEVNNTMAGVTSTLDTANGALSDIEETEDIREVMAACIERCFSLSHFITRFADVVKIPEPQKQRTNLNILVENCIQTMDAMLSEHSITMHRCLHSTPIYIDVDVPLMEQVIVNILKNAVESIGSDGDISVTTTADDATLVIADNGAGISEDTRKRLFSPFFSTKPNGQGIGLIFIREVLLKHQCNFSLKTYADNITRFTIKFF